MNQPDISLVYGLLFSLFHIFLVTIALKCVSKVAPVLIHALSALVTLCILCIFCFFYPVNAWIAFCILSFFVSSYLFAFGVVYKSLTIRILCYLRSNNGEVTLESIEEKITLPTFSARIDLLEKMKRISKENDQYRITAEGQKTANIFKAIRYAFRIDTKAVYHVKN